MKGINLEKHFSLSSSSDIQEICLPLQTMGITYFNYLKVYHKDFSRTLLTNRPDWIAHFYKEALYHCNAVVKTEYYADKGFFLWKEMDQFDPAYFDAREGFNIDHGITFVEKYTDFTVLYIFATERNNDAINSLYLKNRALLQRFIYYFNEVARCLIKKSERHKIFLPEEQLRLSSGLACSRESEDVFKNFLEQTIIKRYYLSPQHDLYLTKQQALCAFYTIQGFTVKETARVLDISFRTVEEHLNAVKNKIAVILKKKVYQKEMRTYLQQTGFSNLLQMENYS